MDLFLNLPKNSFSIRVEANAMQFNAPNAEIHHLSYPVPTFQGLIGMLKNIYWHPGIYYVPKKLSFLKKPLMESQGFLGKNTYNNEAILMTKAFYSNIDFILEYDQLVDIQHYNGDVKYNNTNYTEKCRQIVFKRIKKQDFWNIPSLGQRQFPVRRISIESEIHQDDHSLNWNEDIGPIFHSFIPIYYLKDWQEYCQSRKKLKSKNFREAYTTQNFALYQQTCVNKGSVQYLTQFKAIQSKTNEHLLDKVDMVNCELPKKFQG